MKAKKPKTIHTLSLFLINLVNLGEFWLTMKNQRRSDWLGSPRVLTGWRVDHPTLPLLPLLLRVRSWRLCASILISMTLFFFGCHVWTRVFLRSVGSGEPLLHWDASSILILAITLCGWEKSSMERNSSCAIRKYPAEKPPAKHWIEQSVNLTPMWWDPTFQNVKTQNRSCILWQKFSRIEPPNYHQKMIITWHTICLS